MGWRNRILALLEKHPEGLAADAIVETFAPSASADLRLMLECGEVKLGKGLRIVRNAAND